jgi:hypothetical protein
VLGTRAENEHDKYDHDRWGYTDDMVLEMRRCHKLGMSLRAIANRVNEKFDCKISFTGVGKVLRGETRQAKELRDDGTIRKLDELGRPVETEDGYS